MSQSSSAKLSKLNTAMNYGSSHIFWKCLCTCFSNCMQAFKTDVHLEAFCQPGATEEERFSISERCNKVVGKMFLRFRLRPFACHDWSKWLDTARHSTTWPKNRSGFCEFKNFFIIGSNERLFCKLIEQAINRTFF